MSTNTARVRRTRLTFAEYQQVVDQCDETKKPLHSLLGLVGEIGDLHTIFKKLVGQHDYPTFREDLAEEIGDILWYLASVASRYGLPLTDIAQQNIKKAQKLFAPGVCATFDQGYPAGESFPRQFQVVFDERKLGKAIQVRIRMNGVYIGDALTDNAHHVDGYRYHDAFHLAYAAVLGWSPVTRDLLKHKRKSKRKTDEVEDGARAKIVEEAIAIFLFNHAPSRDSFREERSIDISLLKTVMRLCSNLEVGVCTAKQWKRAIHLGFKMFDTLTQHRGGVLSLDLDKAMIEFTPPLVSEKEISRNVRRASKDMPRRLAKGSTANTRRRAPIQSSDPN